MATWSLNMWPYGNVDYVYIAIWQRGLCAHCHMSTCDLSINPNPKYIYCIFKFLNVNTVYIVYSYLATSQNV
jgi:hypothetical protein